MAAHPTESNTDQLLAAVLTELKQLNELMESFTGDGFPLNRAVPSTETIAAIAVAVALLTRHDPRINEQDLQQRLAAAPVISTRLIQQLDSYLQTVQRQQLEALRQR